MSNANAEAKEVFLNALDCTSPDGLVRYLDEACAGDAALRGRVEELLRARRQAGSFLGGKWNSVTEELAISENPGTVIGSYKLLQQIGEGGMGVVFMAEQTEPIQRTVALKIIKPGMDTRQVIARFEAERQALAMMDHPNIAKVLDAGKTDTGRPYFVMELVKGVPITRYCDEKHLSLRERLELFLPVCHAVQHAHQKGIIHRDLKPTNVLVAEYDNHAVSKVIDFGVAKATAQKLSERTMFTEFGQVIGTVEYMSPEQAKFNQLDIDTRSDIYSLGVLLYELLTGSTPFEQKRLRDAAFEEVLRIIREEEPPKPSTKLSSSEALPSVAANRHTEPARLSKDVSGELDWIVMKCLEKDRNRRYETANGLVRDIERHLHDEPVQAGPPSTSYRLRKFARRHKGALTAALLAFAALLLLTAGLAISNRMIAAERNEKAKALELAEAQRARSDANFLKALVAIRDTITGTAMGRDNVPLPLRQKFTDQAIKFYESLIQEDSPDPSLQFDSAVGYRTIAMLHRSWGELEQAEKYYRKAIAILDRLSSEHPAVQQYRHQLGYAHLEFSRMLRQAGRSQETRPLVDRGIKIYVELLAQTPDSSDYIAELANFYLDRIATHDPAATQDGDDPYRHVFDLLERAANLPEMSAPLGDVRGWNNIGHKQRELAFALWSLRRLEETERMFRYAVRAFEKLKSLTPENAAYWHFLADTHREVGRVLLDRKKPKEAEQEFRKAVEIHEQRVAKKIPGDYVNDLEWSLAYLDLARSLIKAGRTKEAIPLVTRGVEVAPANDGRPVKLKAELQLANLLRETENYDEAMAKYSEVIATKPDIAEAYSGRGWIYGKLNEQQESEADFAKVVELQPKQSEGWTGRAFSHFHRQQWELAVADFTKAIELDPKVHTNWLHRGHSHLQLRKWDKAATDFAKLVEQWPQDSGGWFFLAAAHAQMNRPSEALSDLHHAISNGFKDKEQLKTYSLLDPIRSDPDFQKSVAELEKSLK